MNKPRESQELTNTNIKNTIRSFLIDTVELEVKISILTRMKSELTESFLLDDNISLSTILIVISKKLSSHAYVKKNKKPNNGSISVRNILKTLEELIIEYNRTIQGKIKDDISSEVEQALSAEEEFWNKLKGLASFSKVENILSWYANNLNLIRNNNFAEYALIVDREVRLIRKNKWNLKEKKRLYAESSLIFKEARDFLFSHMNDVFQVVFEKNIVSDNDKKVLIQYIDELKNINDPYLFVQCFIDVKEIMDSYFDELNAK